MIIDLRSDTVTRPTASMRRVMADAEVGDDVLGDDPTVLRLQERVAEILGKEAACFVPSGTMANQTALRALTEPGDEVIAHEGSHIIHYETGGPAALSGLMVRALPGPRGQFEPEQVRSAMRPPESHFARSRLVVVENTHNRGGGSVWPIERVREVAATARGLGLMLHMDGARLWNACAATGRAASEYAAPFDTVSCCFSKGLGAPAGSAVAGSKALIARVHRFRKMFGGAMRQAGVLAAAALHALEHHRDRLAEDHANARRLAEGLANVPRLVVDPASVETNIVYFEVAESAPMTAAELCLRVRDHGVWMFDTAPRRIRAVCHLDVTAEMITRAVETIARAVRGSAQPAHTGAR